MPIYSFLLTAIRAGRARANGLSATDGQGTAHAGRSYGRRTATTSSGQFSTETTHVGGAGGLIKKTSTAARSISQLQKCARSSTLAEHDVTPVCLRHGRDLDDATNWTIISRMIPAPLPSFLDQDPAGFFHFANNRRRLRPWGYRIANSSVFAYSGWNIDDSSSRAPASCFGSLPAAARREWRAGGRAACRCCTLSSQPVIIGVQQHRQVTVPPNVTILQDTPMRFRSDHRQQCPVDGTRWRASPPGAGYAAGSNPCSSMTMNRNPGRQPPANATEGTEHSGHGVSDSAPAANVSVTPLQQIRAAQVPGRCHSRRPDSVEFNATVVDDNISRQSTGDGDGPRAELTDGGGHILIHDNETPTSSSPARAARESNGTLTNRFGAAAASCRRI